MPLQLFLALMLFAGVMAFTPGPNNVMLAASGVNFGFMRTVPHMIGVIVGFGSLLIAAGAGVGLLLAAAPRLHLVLKVAGAAYLLYLAWRVATAHGSGDGKAPARPFTFVQAATFQLVNPKAMVAVIGGVALYVRPGQEWIDFPLMFTVLMLATIGSTVVWTGFGVALRRFLHVPGRARIFNVSMALLLVLSIVPMML